MTLAPKQTTEKRETAPEGPREEPHQPPLPAEKKPVRRRPARGRRRKKTRTERIVGYLRSRFGRIAGVLFMPQKTFKEIVEDYDYFGVLFITATAILASVGANYILWTTKMSFFDVDLRKPVTSPFPYEYYTLWEGLGFAGFYLARNFLIYYVLSWALRGERNAGLLFCCTGYSLGTQVIGRLVQVFLSYYVIPPVEYPVSTETSIILLTASVQQLLIHQEASIAVAEGQVAISRAWHMSLGMMVFSTLTYLVNAWTAVLAAVAIRTATRLSWRRSALVAGAVFALDTLSFVYGQL